MHHACPMWIGSSPRLWGTRGGRTGRSMIARFIPTPVGNTWKFCSGELCRAVHPHACGEHSSGSASPATTCGSSPRLWGTRRAVRSVCSHHSVHPHACGEHTLPDHDPETLSGSSPRLWGTLSGDPDSAGHPRFIPTPVGNTRPSGRAPGSPAVHPHACGEHTSASSGRLETAGSSPRLWGTRRSACSRSGSTRFIPTPVGNTVLAEGGWNQVSVHPHACGEHALELLTPGRYRGSSPRLWGTRWCTPRPPEARRFIPTPVGNTGVTGPPRPASAVHPHACGEHTATWGARWA